MCLLHSLRNGNIKQGYKICTDSLIIPGFQEFPSDGSRITDENYFMNDRKTKKNKLDIIL